PPLFALWVNLDGWFVLGPLTVAVYLAGTALRAATLKPDAPDRPPVRPLAIVLVVGLLACLLTPHLHRAFVLPRELPVLLANVPPESVASGGVAIQAAAKELPQLPGWPSPFNQIYWSRTDVGLNVAGLAYFLLLLVSAASFALPVLAPAHPARAGGAAARFA